MYISRIELKNWRNFASVGINLSEKTIIIGPNAAGKSNLLDSFRFLRDLARQAGGLQAAVKQRGGLNKIRSLSSRKDNRVAINIELSDDGAREWRYEIEFNQKGQGVVGETLAVLTHEKLIRFSAPGRREKTFISRDPLDEPGDLAEYTYIEQASVRQDFKEFVEFLNGVSYLHLVPQLVRDPNSFIQRNETEDYFGRDFIRMVASTPGSTRTAYLKRISKFLTFAVPGFETMQVEKDEITGEPHLIVEFSSWRGINAKQTEAQLSDGTLRLIGLLWALQSGNKPVLLEEPELSLHPEIVKRLYRVISELYENTKRKRQVILTTHSFDFLNNPAILPHEVILLEVTTKGTVASSLGDRRELRELLESGFTVAETALKKVSPYAIDQLTLEV